jgi:hypothetical protein
MILAAAFLIGLVIRCWNLPSLPAEMWGDVIEHYKLAESILHGHFFLNFQYGGDGPMFSYLAVLITLFKPLSFESLKLTSAIIGALLIPLVYIYTWVLFNKKTIANVSAILAAVGFWGITFSRQAKPYILVPVIVATGLILLIKKRRFLAGLVLGTGMYSQAAYWGGALLWFLNPITLLGGITASVPFWLTIIEHGTRIGSNSYIGEKILGISVVEGLMNFLRNIKLNFSAFWVLGDGSFRHNIPFQPHLDFVTGWLFAVGLVLILWKCLRHKDKKLMLYLIFPLVAMQISSLLDVTTAVRSANMGRMIGVLPMVLAIAAYGFDRMQKWVKPKIWGQILGVILLMLVGGINLWNYFVIYPQTLPNRNVPFGGEIAQFVNKFPTDIPIILVGCCWGDNSQPEPGGIFLRLMPRRNYYYLEENTAQLLTGVIWQRIGVYSEVIVVTRPKNNFLKNNLGGVFRVENEFTIKDKYEIAHVFLLQKN